MENSNTEENDEMNSILSSEDLNTDTRCSTLNDDSFGYSRTCSENSTISEELDESICYETRAIDWSMPKPEVHKYPVLPQANSWRNSHFMNEKNNDRDLEIEMMKMRFSKLLLGEDMSGSGKGVCTAVAVSNAITNLYATVFGHFWKLEPLPPEKKLMWKREMECLLCVCDYIVEFFPSSQTLQDGTVVEVMKSRPRSDIYMNLPALQKLDAMLLDIFDSFRDPEFWYLDERNPTKNARSFGSFRQVIQRKDEKWWMPIPCVPSCGLSEKWKTHLQNKRECANQILKAAMAINSSILAEMKVPEIYMDSLPKHGRAILGDAIHRYISTDHFSTECLLDCLNVTSEHEALELADRIEASIYVWKRKSEPKISKSSWDVVKDFVIDGEKNEILLSRAESLLSALKKRYPGLSQTTLDTCKIQYNKDIGQSILESYSRVLESLSFNMVAWIEDVLAADKSIKHSSH